MLSPLQFLMNYQYLFLDKPSIRKRGHSTILSSHSLFLTYFQMQSAWQFPSASVPPRYGHVAFLLFLPFLCFLSVKMLSPIFIPETQTTPEQPQVSTLQSWFGPPWDHSILTFSNKFVLAPKSQNCIARILWLKSSVYRILSSYLLTERSPHSSQIIYLLMQFNNPYRQ